MAGGISKPFSRLRRAGWEAAVLALLLAGCGRSAGERQTGWKDGDGPLEMLVANDPETLDPRYVTDAVGLRATRLVHAGLVRLDPDTLAPLPYVARGWRWIDPLTLEVDLRDDLRFHSGAPLRASDVVATLRAFASPAVASRHASVVDAIAEVSAEGEHRVVIRLARPHATLLTDLELPILRADQAASPPAPDGSLDGLGPYVVSHAATGEVRLVPADEGALPRPARAVTLRVVHDENARALRLEAGTRRRRVEPRVADAAPCDGLAARAGRRVAPGREPHVHRRRRGAPPARRRARPPGALGGDRSTRCSARRSSTGTHGPRVASSRPRTGPTRTRRPCRSTRPRRATRGRRPPRRKPTEPSDRVSRS